MKCQNCNENEASIHLYINDGRSRKQIDLCSTCYAKLNNQQQNNNNNIRGRVPNQGFPFEGNPEDLFKQFAKMYGQQATADNQDREASQEDNTFLGKFGTNFTDLAKNGEFDPVIGRDEEIQRVIEILNRRTKNNPVLIGEAGVGKTAVAEGLAQKIIDQEVPQKLIGKEVISLDVASLVQDTGIRGQFEKKMQDLMDELRENDDIILFIDEIHEIVGAGTAGDSSMDVGNILKPALARGEIQLVGATTLNEYRVIEKDSALERRLQPVRVEEPSIDEAIEILEGLRPRYEDYHQVKYDDEVIEAAVKLSNRYIQDRHLPDKAIDLIDEAGSRLNLTIPAVDEEFLDKQIDELEKLKEMALDSENYEKAAFYRDQLQKYTELKENSKHAPEQRPSVTVQDLEQIIETKTGIPVGDLEQQERSQLQTLEADLKEKVIGQDEAVEAITKAIRRNRIGLNLKDRPIGSFLFIGPTGVGKTELARQLGNQMFGSQNDIIRFDMSEYMEKHSVSKLIGSPPGYVGYEEAGLLTEQVRRNAYSIILLDEIEKAHPDVLNIFLQIMEDGRLTDAQGRVVSFKDTILIMTSNAGTANIESAVGFGAQKSGNQHSVLNQLTDYFKPEFLNRFDAIVEFQPLTKEDLQNIVGLMLNDVNQMLAVQGINIVVDDKARQQLVDIGFDPKLGARPLRRVIQTEIEDQVADLYLENDNLSTIYFTLNEEGGIQASVNPTETRELTTVNEETGPVEE